MSPIDSTLYIIQFQTHESLAFLKFVYFYILRECSGISRTAFILVPPTFPQATSTRRNNKRSKEPTFSGQVSMMETTETVDGSLTINTLKEIMVRIIDMGVCLHGARLFVYFPGCIPPCCHIPPIPFHNDS